MATNYGQTILGAWDQAGAMDLRNQQAREAQRINDHNQYADVWNRLQAQGIIDIAKEGPNRGYATFNMEEAMRILPKGGLANYLDFALRKSNLTKYEGADGRLKQGKIVGVHKITAEEDPNNAGMYAIAIKNDKGVMSFLSRDRKEGGKDPLLLDAEDIQRYADIGARAILARTPQASQVTYGMMADDLESMKKKNQRDDAVSALATTKREADLASIGLNPDETIDLNSPVSRRIAAEEQILMGGEGDTRPDAALDQTGAIETVYADSKTGEGPEIIGDNERKYDQRGYEVMPKSKKEVEYKQLGLWEGEALAQSKMKAAMREIETELGRPEDQTPLAQDMTGPAGTPSEGNIKKVFEHLGLPTKSGLVTKDHWRQARDYMMSLKGDPTAKTVTTLEQAENKTIEDKETLIENNEMPDADAATELQEALVSAEIGTMEDYLKWADETLPPATRDYANWVIAAMGSGGDPGATLSNYQQLSGQVERKLRVDEGNLKATQDRLKFDQAKELAGVPAKWHALAQNERNVLTDAMDPLRKLEENYVFDYENGKYKSLDGETTLGLNAVIDTYDRSLKDLAAYKKRSDISAEAKQAANVEYNESVGRLIELMAADHKWTFGRDFWNDAIFPAIPLVNLVLGSTPTQAVVGDAWQNMAIVDDHIVMTSTPNTEGGPRRETRNSVPIYKIQQKLGLSYESVIDLLTLNNIPNLNLDAKNVKKEKK